jgi:outer membrane protein OmpA-like peptidoglycan-associated protein
MKNLLLSFLLILSVASCKAQPPVALTTKSKKAQKAYNEALVCAQQYDYKCAFDNLATAKKEDPNFVEAYMLGANLYLDQREWAKAVDQFKKAFAINPAFYPSSYYDCAQAELKLGRYEDAKSDFQVFLAKKQNPPPYMVDNAKNGIANCDFAIKAKAHPVPFNPQNMGGAINTDSCEYFPNVTADDGIFLFTRNHQFVDPNTGLLNMSQEDFYISFKNEDGTWSNARNMGPPINTPANEGAPSLSPDGRFLFFAACDEEYGYGGGRQGFGSCDIFYTHKVNGQWSKPANVGAPLNSNAWESQPSFSSDGKTLYYISNRRGGYGDSDIWMAVLGEDGKWSTPVNLGENINTSGKEEAVFIHPDNQTLYFASDGHVGMGGLDLFMCRRDSVTGKWGNPVNLGYPINTSGDESGLIVNGKGNLAYFSSTRDGGKGCDDIYSFELPKNLQPVPVTYMKGKVFNKVTGKPIGANFDLIDVESGKTIVSSLSDPVTGEFLVCVPVNKNYALNVNSPGYIFFSERFEMKLAPDPNKPFRMDVPLQPIGAGVAVELKNVFFETGKYDLKPTSTAELDRTVAWLRANPAIKAEISGHTDNVGDKKMNQVLSENRAKAVYAYLVSHGIDAARLSYKGYGDTKPKVPNDSDEHRQMNRRVEMTVTGI